MQKQARMLSYLLEENVLDEETLQKVLEQQKASGQSLLSILKENNLVDEEQLTKIIAASNKIEFINLSPEMIEPMAAHMVTYEMANQHNMIPVKKENNKLLVAMSTPLNLARLFLWPLHQMQSGGLSHTTLMFKMLLAKP
jgi:type IV pilus assembly protein PilB